MGKWIGIAAVLALTSGAVYAWSGWEPPAGRACAKLETLCGEATMPAAACMDELADASSTDLEGLEACVIPADSCLEVTGCLAGSVAREFGQGALRGLIGP